MTSSKLDIPNSEIAVKTPDKLNATANNVTKRAAIKAVTKSNKLETRNSRDRPTKERYNY